MDQTSDRPVLSPEERLARRREELRLMQAGHIRRYLRRIRAEFPFDFIQTLTPAEVIGVAKATSDYSRRPGYQVFPPYSDWVNDQPGAGLELYEKWDTGYRTAKLGQYPGKFDYTDVDILDGPFKTTIQQYIYEPGSVSNILFISTERKPEDLALYLYQRDRDRRIREREAS